MKSGQSQKKQYIYHKHLLFLLKIIKEDSTTSNIVKSSQDSDNESRPGTSSSLNPSQDSDNESRPGISAIPEPITTPGSSQDDSSASIIRSTASLTQNPKKRLNPVDVEILKAIQSHGPRQDEFKDDDKAFLMSILPTIKRISEDDRLEFRIDVMQLLRKYTNRIRLSSLSSASSSPLPPLYASVNSPTNEVTPSPPHLPQTEHQMIAPSIYYPSAPSTSPPPPHVTLPSPTSPPQMENQMIASPISPAESVSLLTITELLQQDFENF